MGVACMHLQSVGIFKLHLLHYQSYAVTERVIGGKERKLEVMAVDITLKDLPEAVQIEYRVAALDVLGNRGTQSAPLFISTGICTECQSV